MKRRSQYWTFLAILAVLSLALSACAGAAPAGDDTIKIGAALCLTGIQAPLDEPALKGAQVAVEEINKKGGVLDKQLELINLDCKSDPVTTGNVAVQLIDQGAQAIIAPSDFDFGGPASREAQKAGRACLQCGKPDEPLRPFGVIGNLSGALHEWCLEAFRGEDRRTR